MYILHRKLNQPRSGRRILSTRRMHEQNYDPNRRDGRERRILTDRRKTSL